MRKARRARRSLAPTIRPPFGGLALAPTLALALNYSVIDSVLCHRLRHHLIFQVPGLGRQVSGADVLVRVQVQENPVPEPGADDLNQGPDGRDQRPESCLALINSALHSALNADLDSVLPPIILPACLFRSKS